MKFKLPVFYLILLTACSPKEEKSKENTVSTISTIIAKAQKGDTAAQFTLGFKYYFGDEVDQNKDSSKYWLGKAAEAGHVRAKSTYEAFFTIIPKLNSDTLK